MASPTTAPTPREESAKVSAFSFETAEKLAKSIIALVALMYGLGLFVTNRHLLSLGISDFSALRPKYVLTGAWILPLLLLSSLPAIFPFLTWRRLSRMQPRPRPSRFLVAVTISFLAGSFSNWFGYITMFVLLHVQAGT